MSYYFIDYNNMNIYTYMYKDVNMSDKYSIG